ncbi:MAG: mechanosensitive ion channel family protein [Marinifilaceae bacterium]
MLPQKHSDTLLSHEDSAALLKSEWIERIGTNIHNHEMELLVHDALIVAIVLLISALIFVIIRRYISRLILKLIGKTKTHWDDILYNERFFSKITYLIPPIALHFALLYINLNHDRMIREIIYIWISVVFLLIFNSLLNAINKIYESYPISKNRPITVFIQITKIFLYCIVLIVIFSIIFNKSPKNLIVGLGAFAAVLMLIFKDSILGFVAGIQLIANDMLRIGDWIEMQNNFANGTVLEINLYTVKVQNWDMTISTIPTYQLVSSSFINWRGMQDSNGRRICRSINIDMESVHFLTDDEIETLKSSKILGEYIQLSLNELAEVNRNKSLIIDERRLSNIGVFRHYMDMWIANNPNINTDMTHMVRQLQPTAAGMPIQIYCFTYEQSWVPYEHIQADIFDHIMAVIPVFNLRILQFAIPDQVNGVITQ